MTLKMEEYGLGWTPELEGQHAGAVKGMCRAFRAAPLEHETLDPIDVIPCNDQLQFNSCDGNATAKAMEYCNWVKTGKFTKLSARNAYLRAKEADGTLNQGDAGASIGGGVLGAQRAGSCLETTFPYWQPGERFSTAIPQAAANESHQHLLVGAQTPIEGSDDGLSFLDQGFGAIVLGIMWTTELANCTGIIDFVNRGRILGGHALCVLGFKMYQGDRWFRLYNSHSPRWGDRGTALVSRRVFDAWAQARDYEMIGVSDLQAFGERRRFKSWAGMIR